jgi:hypothetical protein
MRKHLLVLSLLSLLTAIGCRHNTSGPPPSPAVVTAATLLDASNTTVTVEDGLTAASHALDQLQATDPEYYAKVDPLIKKISAANVLAAKKIKLVKDTGTGDWRPAILAVASSVNVADLNTVGVKNPTSQTIVAAALATLVGVLNAIPKTFGGTQ